MEKPLENFVALIAGGSRGAGRGAALSLGELGATVYIAARSTSKKLTFADIPFTIEGTANEVNQRGGIGIPVQCDFGDLNQVDSLIKKIEKEKGKLDLLVNSAWGGEEILIDQEPFWKSPPEKWETPFWTRYQEYWENMFNKGVKNYLNASCRAIPLMIQNRRGLIVNVSYWDDNKYLGEFFYDLAKSTMNRMAFGFAFELKNYNIAALSLSPGFMKTEVVMTSFQHNPEKLKEKFGDPNQSTEYIGRAIAALARDQYILVKSGKVLRVSDLAKEYGFTDIDGKQP